MRNKCLCECGNFNCFFGQEMVVAYSQCPCCSDTLIPVSEDYNINEANDGENDE